MRPAPSAGAAALAVLALVLGVLALAPAAHAVQGDLFTVENVAVDATEDTAAAAREVALAEGYRQAFGRLVDRLVPRQYQTSVPDLSPERIATLVRNFEVGEEKTSTVRYLATLTIRFKGEAVRNVLKDAGVPFAETESDPLLVLPVMRRGGALLLWDDPNPWREAWAATPLERGLVPLIVPHGGLQDLSIISAQQAAQGEAERIEAIAGRYGAKGALIAIAAPAYGAGGRIREIDVRVRRTNDPENRAWRHVVRPKDDAASAEDVFARAARETAALVQEEWKNQYLLHFDQQHELVVTVPLAKLEELVTVRRRLADVAFVSESDLVALSRGAATIRLRYVGAVEQLQTALARSDLSLSQGPVSPVLQLGSGNRAGSAPGTGR